jgi:hypothetical protein
MAPSGPASNLPLLIGFSAQAHRAGEKQLRRIGRIERPVKRVRAI